MIKIKRRINDLVSKYLLAKEEKDSGPIRRKHIRLAIVAILIVTMVCYVFLDVMDDTKSSKPKIYNESGKVIERKNVPAVEELTKGVKNETLWIEREGQEVENLKQKIEELKNQNQELIENLNNNKISKEDLAVTVRKLENDFEEKYNKKIAEELSKHQIQNNSNNQTDIIQAKLDTRVIKKTKVKRIGDYIPAGSYAKGKLISGVDAGVGVSAQSDPRQTLIRITGEATSAGLGADYLKTDRLIGCILQAKTVGDISSEKAYMDAVLITCAKDKNTLIEIPVKGYITSQAKVGVRGEVVSREGDMVLKSFLSGLTSGFGGAMSQSLAPSMSIGGGGIVSTDKQKAKNIALGGLGGGVSSSGDRLSEYFIERAEQYQPVISVAEGVEVYVVFQEGFDLKEVEDDKSK